MSLIFPSSPTVGLTTSIGDKTWEYNGEGWQLVATVVVGTQGSQGLQGLSNQGTQGLQGNQGLQGDQGSQGLQGLQGLSNQGSQGLQGLQGPQGLQGLQGLSNQGSQGLQGLQGPQGLQGLSNQGSQGLQGLQGPQGLQGLQGLSNQGSQGLQGLQGLSNQGSQGLQGLQGPQGLQGLQGLSNQGSQGLQGLQGPQGLQGLQGLSNQGSQGLQGLQGPQGLQGLQGLSNQGSQGLQGLQGPQGLQGLQGPQGLQGLSNQGSQGLQGLQGLQGPQGLQGLQGLSNQGTQGLQGLQGLQGNQGSFVVYNQSTAPSSPNVGDYWVDNSDGTTYVYYNDGNSSQWVEFGPTPQEFNNAGITVYDNYPTLVGFSSIVDFGTGLTVTPLSAGIVTVTSTATGGGGGSGTFDTTINNALYIEPTGTLNIVGVGTTTSQITTFPGTSGKEYIINSMHVTNISNGDAEITAGFVMNVRKVPATISVSVGSSGGPGIHTFTVGSASSITVGMAVTGTGNIGETTGIGSTAGFQYNTYVTSVDGNTITLSKPMSGRATGTVYFTSVSKVVSRLPVPVGSAVELFKQPMVLNALDSIVLQSTGAGSGIGSTSTTAISQTANSNFLTVTVGAAITNFIAAGQLILPTGALNTGIQTNTFVGVGYTPGSLSIPMTRPATTSLASTSFTFTEVVVPQDGALEVTLTYKSVTDTAYNNGTGTVVGIVSLSSLSVPGVTSTTPSVYYGAGLTYPSVIQSIRVTNISDSGDYPVYIGIGNSDTIFNNLAYNLIVPKNSSIEICESPKYLGIGQSIFAYSNTPGVLEIQIAGKQITS
jgi:hypothetical protein